MKISLRISLALFTVGLLALPTKAAPLTITTVGETDGAAQLPGSAADFAFFNNSDWYYATPGDSLSALLAGHTPYAHSVSPYSDLTSLGIAGGIQTYGGSTTGFSSIQTPAGGAPVLTGALAGNTSYTPSPGVTTPAGSTMAIGISPGSNVNFNYNDFNVYVLFANDGGIFTDNSIGLVGPNASFDANNVAVTDSNLGTSKANYLEFNVKNFASSDSAYLVLSSYTTGGAAYLGGVSFESVTETPEPSTWAMMAAGLVFLGVLVRRKSAHGKI